MLTMANCYKNIKCFGFFIKTIRIYWWISRIRYKKAIRIQKKVSNVGFEWEEINDVKHKIYEEIEELNEEIKSGAREKIQDEFGDVLFSLINYARFLDIDPDYCLEKSNKKFIKRFKLLEKKMKQNRKNFENTSISELNEYWNSVK